MISLDMMYVTVNFLIRLILIFFFVTTKLTSIYICVDFIESACTESLESQDQ